MNLEHAPLSDGVDAHAVVTARLIVCLQWEEEAIPLSLLLIGLSGTGAVRRATSAYLLCLHDGEIAERKSPGNQAESATPRGEDP